MVLKNWTLHRFLVIAGYMALSAVKILRSAKHTKHIFDNIDRNETTFQDGYLSLIEMSIHKKYPVISNFNTDNTKIEIDVYNIFHFDPVHKVHLGVSKMMVFF